MHIKLFIIIIIIIIIIYANTYTVYRQSPIFWVPNGTSWGVVYWTRVWHLKRCHMAPFIATVHWLYFGILV